MSIQKESHRVTLSSPGAFKGLSPFWTLLASAGSSPSPGRAAPEDSSFTEAAPESLAIGAIEALDARNQALFESAQPRPENNIDYEAFCISPVLLHPPGWVEEEIWCAVASGTVSDTRRPSPISGYDGNKPLVNHPPTYPALPPKPEPRQKRGSKPKQKRQTAAQPEPQAPRSASAGRKLSGSQRRSVDRCVQGFAADGGLCRSEAGKKNKKPTPPLRPPERPKARCSPVALREEADGRNPLSPVSAIRESPPTWTAGSVQQPETTSPIIPSPQPPNRCGAHRDSYAAASLFQDRVEVSSSQKHCGNQLLTPSSTPREATADRPKLMLFPSPTTRASPLERAARTTALSPTTKHQPPWTRRSSLQIYRADNTGQPRSPPPLRGPTVPQPCGLQVSNQPSTPSGQTGLVRAIQSHSGDGTTRQPTGNPRQDSTSSSGHGAPHQSPNHHLHYHHQPHHHQHHRQVAVGQGFPGKDLPPKIPVVQEVGVPAKSVAKQLQDQMLCQEVHYHPHMSQCYHQNSSNSGSCSISSDKTRSHRGGW